MCPEIVTEDVLRPRGMARSVMRDDPANAGGDHAQGVERGVAISMSDLEIFRTAEPPAFTEGSCGVLVGSP